MAERVRTPPKQRPCALCEKSFKLTNLPGVATFRALADWRAARGAPYDARDRRFHVARLYTQQRLCLFCTQFFDKTYSDYVQYHRNATVVSSTEPTKMGNTARVCLVAACSRMSSCGGSRLKRMLDGFSMSWRPRGKRGERPRASV